MKQINTPLNNLRNEDNHSKINNIFLAALFGNLSLEDMNNFELKSFGEDSQ